VSARALEWTTPSSALSRSVEPCPHSRWTPPDNASPHIHLLLSTFRVIGVRLTGQQLKIAIEVFREEAAALVDIL